MRKANNKTDTHLFANKYFISLTDAPNKMT